MLPVSDFSMKKKFFVSSPLTNFLPHRLKDEFHEYLCISTNIHEFPYFILIIQLMFDDQLIFAQENQVKF